MVIKRLLRNRVFNKSWCCVASSTVMLLIGSGPLEQLTVQERVQVLVVCVVRLLSSSVQKVPVSSPVVGVELGLRVGVARIPPALEHDAHGLALMSKRK